MATPKAKRRKKFIIFSVIVLVLIGLGAVAFFRKREPVITVQVEKVTRRNLTELVPVNGRIQPVFKVNISPEVSGEIIELPVKEGQQVKKGDLLVHIRPEDYVAARNSAEASYKGALAGKDSATATLLKSEADFKRNETLHQTGLVSDSDFQQAQMSYDVAKAQLESASHNVEMAEAALRRADEDLRKTTIFSPLDGTVSKLNSHLGERVVGTAMMAGTEIMTIADLNEMEARVDVGENDIVLIKTGQIAKLEVDAFKDRKFTGVVTEIANTAENATATGSSQDATKFEVKIRIKDKEAFRPGMSVTAEVETRYRTNVLTVPIASVTTRLPKETGKKPGEQPAATNSPAGTNHATAAASTKATDTNATSGTRKTGEAPKPIEVVFIKDGDHAKMVPVKRGISDDAYTEIVEGVAEGQEVISGGYKAISRELEDGKRIKVGPAPFAKEMEKK
jgi:HlyD family secretion protein